MSLKSVRSKASIYRHFSKRCFKNKKNKKNIKKHLHFIKWYAIMYSTVKLHASVSKIKNHITKGDRNYEEKNSKVLKW